MIFIKKTPAFHGLFQTPFYVLIYRVSRGYDYFLAYSSRYQDLRGYVREDPSSFDEYGRRFGQHRIRMGSGITDNFAEFLRKQGINIPKSIL